MSHRHLNRRPDGYPDDDTGEWKRDASRHHVPGNYDTTTGSRYIGSFVAGLVVLLLIGTWAS